MASLEGGLIWLGLGFELGFGFGFGGAIGRRE